LAAVRQHEDHPFVRQYFWQVPWLKVGATHDKLLDLHMIEFRDGLRTAFIWQDEQGNWGAGPWIRVAHEGADVLCPPTEFSLNYFHDAQAHPTFVSAMDQLASTRAESAVPPEQAAVRPQQNQTLQRTGPANRRSWFQRLFGRGSGC
jgi:hypothetical protein